MTTKEAIDVLYQLLEQNLAAGNIKTIKVFDTVRDAIATLEKAVNEKT